jgi:hypothetical protein
MLSHDSTMTLLIVALGVTGAFIAGLDDAEARWHILVACAALAPVMRTFFFLGSACESKVIAEARNEVLASDFARSSRATLCRAFPAPVIEAPILDLGMARVRFHAERLSVTRLCLRFRSPSLRYAPWLLLEGNSSFLVPAAVLGAKAVPTRGVGRDWRYWRLPRRPPVPAVESPNFCAALPAVQNALVLTSRPGRLLIRARCAGTATQEFEYAVRLAIAWVEAVQRTSGASPR